MCFKVDCRQCGKSSWGGCGKHLTTLYATIETGNHCLCRPWPGVAVATPPAHNATNQPPLAAPPNPPTAGVAGRMAS
nr:uncharacterized protein LOC110663218 [Ipomoea trifida]